MFSFQPQRNQILRLFRRSSSRQRYLSVDTSKNGYDCYMWGTNKHGSIWKSAAAASSMIDIPVEIETSERIHRIVCGPTDTAMIDNNTACYVSGHNKNGQLGVGNTQPVPDPMLVELPDDSSIVQVALGAQFAAYVNDKGDLYTCGWNGSTLSGGIGGLGLGDAEQRLEPTLVESLVEDQCKVQQVTVGEAHLTVLTTEGEVLTAGSGSYGRLGNFENVDQLYLEPVELLTSGVTEIAGGKSFTLALKEDGVVYGWGRNHKGQLGVGMGLAVDMYAMQAVPEPIDTDELSNRKVMKIAAGHSHAAAITESGELFIWGMSINFEPVRADALIHTKVVDVCCGEDYTLALDCEGRLYSFGQGKTGTLGQGSVRYLSEPTYMEAFENRKVVQVSAGWKHAACLVEPEAS